MREYGRVEIAFWTGVERQLSSNGKLFMLYARTSPHSNAIGCYRLPDAYIADDLDWSLEMVRETLTETVSKGFISRDSDGWIRLPNHFELNPVDNPNIGKHCAALVDLVPKNSPLFEGLIESMKPFVERLPEPFRNRYINPSETESSSSSKNSSNKNAAEEDAVVTRASETPALNGKEINLRNYDAAAACCAAVHRRSLTATDEMILLRWHKDGYDIEKDVLPVLVEKSNACMKKKNPMPANPLAYWDPAVIEAAKRRKSSEKGIK